MAHQQLNQLTATKSYVHQSGKVSKVSQLRQLVLRSDGSCREFLDFRLKQAYLQGVQLAIHLALCIAPGCLNLTVIFFSNKHQGQFYKFATVIPFQIQLRPQEVQKIIYPSWTSSLNEVEFSQVQLLLYQPWFKWNYISND